MQLDAHMPEDQKQIVLSILQNETRPESLAWAADAYDVMGYPVAANALRNRAYAFATPLDTHMPDDQKQIVRSILQNETRPDSLDWAANTYQAMGYPFAAQALRNRAEVLRSGSWPMEPPQAPQVPQVPQAPEDNEPPAWTWPQVDPAPTQQTAGADSSLMPMLALLGAGLAFT